MASSDWVVCVQARYRSIRKGGSDHHDLLSGIRSGDVSVPVGFGGLVDMASTSARICVSSRCRDVSSLLCDGETKALRFRHVGLAVDASGLLAFQSRVSREIKTSNRN